MRHMGKNPQPAALARTIAAGATPMRAVETMPCGQTIAYVADSKPAWDRAGCWKPGTFKQVLGPDALFLGAAASNSFTFDAEFIA